MAGIAFSLRAARSITSLPFPKLQDYDLNLQKVNSQLQIGPQIIYIAISIGFCALACLEDDNIQARLRFLKG